MYCKYCGKELAPEAVFCSSCGKPVGDQPSQPKTVVTPVVKTEEKPKSETFIRGAKIALLLCMVCFLFPFLLVSCASETVSVSGVELILKTSIDKDKQEALEDCAPNIFLIGSFAAALVGELLLMNQKNLDSAKMSAWISAALLIVFRVTLVPYYQLEDEADYLNYSLQWGWVFAFLSGVAAGGFLLARKHFYPEKNPIRLPHAAQPDYSIKNMLKTQESGEDIPSDAELKTDEAQMKKETPNVLLELVKEDVARTISVDEFPCEIDEDGVASDSSLPMKSNRIRLTLEDGQLAAEPVSGTLFSKGNEVHEKTLLTKESELSFGGTTIRILSVDCP